MKIQRYKKGHSFDEEPKKALSPKERVLNALRSPIVASILVAYVIIIIVTIFHNANAPAEQSSLEEDKSSLLNTLTGAAGETALRLQQVAGTDVIFVEDGEINKEKLKEFSEMDYEELKALLNMQNDFCIHFEDQEGNIIDISDITKRNGVGIGSQALEFSIVDSTGKRVGVTTC